MHAKRLITAAIALPAAVAYVMLLPPVFFTVIICVVSVIGIHEFYAMYDVKPPLSFAGLLFAVLIPASAEIGGSVYGYLVVSAILMLVLRLLMKKDTSGALSDVTAAALGVLYIPVLLSFQTGIMAEGPQWILFLYGTAWGADSAALYIGSWFGQVKLYPSVSPNKTVEGAAAAVVGGAICAFVLKLLLVASLSAPNALLLGAVMGVVTVAGDLVESMFKRDAGVKDSSTLVPGHGGILDKTDGVLFAGPVLYLVLSVL